MQNKFEATTVGIPHGGPLSPLLSNIMLNELDKEIQKRGHRFVCYADDLVILCKCKHSAQRPLVNIVPDIEGKLGLKVNREKTTVAYISGIKFLVYSFYINRKEGRLHLHPKSLNKILTDYYQKVNDLN